MNRFLFFIIILLAPFSSKAQGDKRTDSLVIVTLNSIIDRGHNFLKDIQLDSSESNAFQALKYSEDKGYSLGKARAFGLLTLTYLRRGDNAKALDFTKKADFYIRQIGDKHNMAVSSMNIGGILYKDGQYAASLEYMTKAYEDAKEAESHQLINTLNFNITSIYIKLEKPLGEILLKAEEAEKLARNTGDTTNLLKVLSNKGLTHVKNKFEVTQAIDYFLESLTLHKLSGSKDVVAEGFAHDGLAGAYFLQNRLRLALQHNDSALANFKKMKYKLGLRDTHRTRKDILFAQKNFKEAFIVLNQLTYYLDTIYDEQRSQQLNLVRTQYETEKKEAKIQSLSQESAIQALELKQKNQSIIIGLVLILSVLIAVYFSYKQRESKKQQTQTELEQRFLRSQLNPHFISNALVAVQSFMLKNDSGKAAIYLTKFSKLMREILENSRKEFIPVEEEISMITNYLDIHKLRLESFDFKIHIDEDIDPEVDTIPPMFIQPFVENAIEHGISNIKDGHIELKFSKDDEYIAIEINDNGIGLSTKPQVKHNSLSSTIIQERMDLFNKSLKRKITLAMNNIENTKGEISGTRIELKVPFSYI